MRSKKILLLSHIPQRDEATDVMLANYLSGKDMLVWKYPILGKCREAICLIKPDIVILPEVRIEFTRDLARTLKVWGVKVVQKRCEMGISAESDMDEELERCLFGNVEWQEYIDLDLVWGSKFADMLIEHGSDPEKTKVVGGLGFDPYFTPQPNIPRGKNKRILFAGGFGYADCNPLYAIPESRPGDKINLEMVKQDRERREEFLKMMGEVMEAFPDYEYAVRPHPGEMLQTYRDWYGDKFSDMQACITLFAINWADVIIHAGSTMAYEAHLLNKPTLNYRNTSLDTVVGGIAPNTSTSEEMIEAIRKTEWDKSNANPEVIQDLERYYGKVDGKAHQRAGDVIVGLECTGTNIPNEWPKDEPKYLIEGAYINVEQIECTICSNEFHVDKTRSMLKCPYCGVGVGIRRMMQRVDENTGEVVTRYIR